MAEWKQKRGDYPFQDWQDMPENKDAPEYTWKQKQGDYPFKIWQNMPDGKDAPDILWRQKPSDYPFKTWQKMPDLTIINIINIPNRNIILKKVQPSNVAFYGDKKVSHIYKDNEIIF